MKNLKSLILAQPWLSNNVNINAVPDINIDGICAHSVNSKKDFLFVATKRAKDGLKDGHDYIDDAIKNGASAIVVDKDFQPKKSYAIPFVAINDSKTALCYLMEAFYDFPGQELNLIGITGTNGKTSTSFMLHNILTKAGFITKIMGTLGHGEPHNLLSTTHTTMEPEYLSLGLAKFREVGAKYVVMEISSHGLALKRVEALNFVAVGLTNITEDHLDFHESITEYKKAKQRLFFELAKNDTKKVLPFDHPFLDVKSLGNTIFYGSKNDPIFSSDVSVNAHGIKFLLHAHKKIHAISLPFSGIFQVQNATLAASIALSLNIPIRDVVNGLNNCPPIPGRFEPVHNDHGLKIFVDYAHTPDGLSFVLDTAHKLKPKRVIVVFGCAGNRDQNKRFIMGKIAEKLGDIVIVTDDNPRKEDPAKIRQEIMQGIKKKTAIEIPDRYEAILFAIKQATNNDVVIIAGKGHEQYQIYGDDVRAFNDVLAAREVLKLL